MKLCFDHKIKLRNKGDGPNYLALTAVPINIPENYREN